MYGPIVYIFFSIYYTRWSIAGNLSAEWTASSKMDRLVYGKTFPLKKFSFFSGCFSLGKLGRRSKHGAHIEPYWLLRGGLSKPMLHVEAIEDKHLLRLLSIQLEEDDGSEGYYLDTEKRME